MTPLLPRRSPPRCATWCTSWIPSRSCWAGPSPLSATCLRRVRRRPTARSVDARRPLAPVRRRPVSPRRQRRTHRRCCRCVRSGIRGLHDRLATSFDPTHLTQESNDDRQPDPPTRTQVHLRVVDRRQPWEGRSFWPWRSWCHRSTLSSRCIASLNLAPMESTSTTTTSSPTSPRHQSEK